MSENGDNEYIGREVKMFRKIEGNSYNSPSEQLKIYYELDGGWNELFLGKSL